MNKYDLSIIIPSRNEMFLAKTIEDILSHIEGNTEIIAILDGQWANPPVPDNDRVTLIYHNESVGQRAATNEGVNISRAKYIMKVDAHCAFDQGFDVKMMADMQDSWTMAPLMKNLHAFDWVCKKCGTRRYQGPSSDYCLLPDGKTKNPNCDSTEFYRDVVWIPKNSPKSMSYRFDRTLHFQYWGEYLKRPEAQKDITDSLSLQGSCFMCTRKRYLELNICDESWGSWGNQGTEVACKTWLSGGEVKVNHKTWYAHMFRTQGGDFSFPYPQSSTSIEYARQQSREAFLLGRWDKAVHSLSWLLRKFQPVPDWDEAAIKDLENKSKGEPSKGIIYYTDNQLGPKIANEVQAQLISIGRNKNIPIVSSSLKKMNFGDKNIHFPSLKRGYLSMFKQILAALENSFSDIIFFCEHDVIYHPSHFDFVPPEKDKFYYNQNVWRLRMADGFCVHWDCNQVSGLVAYRELLLNHYKNKVKEIEEKGFDGHFEPGGRNTP